MSNAVERALQRSEMIRASVKSPRSGDVMSRSTAMGAIGLASAKMTQAREQERHNFAWVHAAVRVIAQRIAGQPVRVAKRVTAAPAPLRTPDGRGLRTLSRPWVRAAPPFVKQMSSRLELLDEHPLLTAIENPNPYLTGSGLLYVTAFQLELTGQSFWWMRDGDGGDLGTGLEIWPLPASWVKPNHDKKPFSSYTVTPLYSGEEFTVPGDEVCRLHYPDPSDPIFGAYSPLQGNATAVTTDEHIQAAQMRHFVNGVFPAFAFIVGRSPDVNGQPGDRPMLTKEQRAQLSVAVKQTYRGVGNAGEPLILDQLIQDVKRISNTAEEMDFMNSSGLVKDRITQGFGVNPISMGQVEGANRASSATADDHLCKSCVNPKITFISQCLTQWVAPRFGDAVAFIEEAKASDPDQERLDRDQLIKAGAMTKNELRQALGMEPRDDGDELIEPGQPPLTLDAGGAAALGRSFRVSRVLAEAE
ncbi:phage portal protein [Gemmata sp.]|uniref:phage portal protein n=1 Tax=Gemmata sp. TaxID=1914242 RepID=UPI003F72066D